MNKLDLKEKLRSAGLRATAPRVAVLSLLESSERPLSHAEVVAKIGQDDWDPVTIFRNLVKLEEAGFARVASRVGGITRFEISDPDDAPHVHPHFACKDCSHVTCVHDAVLRLPKNSIWSEALRDADLQLVGRCPACRASSAEDGSEEKPFHGRRYFAGARTR